MTREEAIDVLKHNYPSACFTDLCEAVEIAIQALSAESEQRWISCEERLPEPRIAVLGYAPKYQNIFALYYDSAYGWMIWSPIRDDCLPNSQGDIVAWMPLPEYYRGEQDDSISN